MIGSRPRNLTDCRNLDDVLTLALRRLPSPIAPSLVGAAETEQTARRNTSAFDEVKLIPRCLVDVSSVRTATRVLGRDIQWPVLCSPTGASRLFHPDGELAVARAAAKAGTFYGLSTMSTHRLEDVAAASSGPKLFQLFIFKDRDLMRDLIRRCKLSGYDALCLTVDTQVRGNCERELRMGITQRLSLGLLARFAARPRWLLGQVRRGALSVAAVAERTGIKNFLANSQWVGAQLDASITWKEVREVIELWGGPFAIKGVMAVDDARRAVDIGATAVIVSNHGGRQLDGAAATIEVLPEIARAVGDQIEVILDGGIRRGVHVLKALARGAKACSIGRAYLFGLAAGGEAGVTKALEILRTELIRAMQLAGCADVRNVERTLASPH
jgi:L-lactate dehydrogenase (cytochrome)